MAWLLIKMRGEDDDDGVNDGDVVMMMSSDGRTVTSLVTSVTGNKNRKHTLNIHRYVHRYKHGLLSVTDKYRK
jgi:hypothetical protein